MSKIKLSLRRHIEKVYFFLFVCLFLIFNRGWFFDLNVIMGHNWDFNFPYELYSKKMNLVSNYLWHDSYGNTNLHITHYLINNAYVFLSHFFTTPILIKVIYFSVFLSSFYSMRYLIYRLTLSKDWGVVSGLLYAFSPFLFSAIIAGSFPQWIAYAFSPIYFYFLSSYLSNGGRLVFVGILISHFFVLIFLQYFVLISISALIFGIFFYKSEALAYSKAIKRLSILAIAFVLINLFWILPFLYQLDDFYSNTIQHASIISGFPAVQNSKQSILHILFGTGFLDRNLYFESLLGVERVLYLTSVCIILILIFVSYIKGRASRPSLFFLSILLIFILLVKGGNAPFGNISMTFYEYFPLMKMYRSPQNIFFIVAFLFPILVATALNKTKKLKLTLLALSIVSMIGWFSAGDIGRHSLSLQNRDHLDFYTMNSDIKKVYENNDKRGLLHKELFIPSANSILFQKNDDQIEAQGQVPEYIFLDKQPIFIENTDNALLLDFQETFDKQFLKQNSIRYITIRNDVAHHHWKQPHNYLKAVQKVLDSSFKKVYDSEIASTYLVKDFIPAFYVCREDDYTFNTLNESYDYGICNIDLSSVNDLDIVTNLVQQEQPSFVEYTKISPVEYRVNIKGIKRNSSFLLRFFQKYDSLWDLVPLKPEQKMQINTIDRQSFDQVNEHDRMDIESYKSFNLTRPEGGGFVSKSFYNSVQNDNITGNKEKLYLLNRSKIDNKFHIPIDANSIGSSSYIALNGWIINTDYLMNNYKDYITPNNDGSYDIEFKVLYYPQKIFYLGLVISASFLLVMLLIFLISRNNITIPNNQ
jgi:hypothetical protein